MPVDAREDERSTPPGPAGASRSVALLTLAGFVARVLTLSHAADNDDAPLFIRGVQRFAVAEGRPHWPGYPVYVAAGKLAAWIVGDPVFGLQIVSAASSAAIAWVAAGIVRAWAESLGALPRDAARAGFFAALLWLVTPMSWVTGSQIISDSPGLLLGVVIVALAIRGERDGSARSWIAAAFLGGLMIGVRLVNVSMLAPLAWKAWSARRERWWGLRPPVVLTAALLAGVAPWLAALALRDPAGYIQAGRQHLGGHFGSYGESIWTDPHPLLRPWVALHTLAVHGLGFGGPSLGWTRVCASVGWMATLVLAARLRPWRGPMARLVGLWAVPHLAYVFFAHDVAYPRYGLSATLALVSWAGLAAAGAKPLALVAPALTAVAAAAVSLPLAIHQGRQPPVESQAARYLARQPGGAVVLGTRADVLLADYASQFEGRVFVVRVPVQDLPAMRRQAAREGRSVFVSALPPEDAAAWVPIAHFCRDRMIEPLSAEELWLFTVGTADPDRPLPACGEER
jgi:hypothetical protein